MALEPTCLAMLALPCKNTPGAEILIQAQGHDGGWAAFAGDDESSGLTGLALFTLNSLRASEYARDRATRWLLQTRGREADWPWRWKFRTTDTRVHFDPDKFAWPWQPGTCSWVVPTAFAVLALKMSFPFPRPRVITSRIHLGVEMLVDRACPGGGWNAGNGVVYGSPMAPHIDATTNVLLALQGELPTEVTNRSLKWLECEVRTCEAPWSLAWSILALHVWYRPVDSLRRRLARLAESEPLQNNATLAAVVLALDCATACNLFKVAP